ncbi:unnamed protein product [Arabis nemorensis]|uniref:Uncharacterized protein n=1 Tax=Arabis nemorensis TaxID=586526 RepID=A0A565CCG0_9BRAS|nr:unnamed protein product [Arabis nemorensis]
MVDQSWTVSIDADPHTARTNPNRTTMYLGLVNFHFLEGVVVYQVHIAPSVNHDSGQFAASYIKAD